MCSQQYLYNNMKYLLSILGIISLGLFASCGGAAEAECCGADGECCSSDHDHDKGNASE